MPDHDRARELLAEILSRAEFDEAGKSLLHRLAGAVNTILAELLARPGLIAAIVLSFVIVAAFLVLLFWIARRFRPSLERETYAPGASGRHTPQSALAGSREAAERGGYKEALRLLLLALLLRLDDEGALEYHYSRTNGEYLRQLQEHGYRAWIQAAELFSLYEKIWYGRVECRREDYDRGLILYRRLQEAGR